MLAAAILKDIEDRRGLREQLAAVAIALTDAGVEIRGAAS